jgi:hypothetical protein
MDSRTRKQLIEQYKDGYRVVAEALAGAGAEELDARPAPGKWTAREVVHHLADSEMTSAVRLRLLLAVDNPAILGYDQDELRQLAARSPDRGFARCLQGLAPGPRGNSRPYVRGRVASRVPYRAAATRLRSGSRSTRRMLTNTPSDSRRTRLREKELGSACISAPSASEKVGRKGGRGRA